MNNNTKQKNSNVNLNYSGEITLKIQKNGKIISTKKYHNAGTNELWKFISYCVAGKYQSAENLRPQYIRLFKNNNEPGGGLNTTDIYTASQIVLMNTSGAPQKWIEDSTIVGYKTILHFLIPFTFITEETVNEVRIYSKINRDSINDCSAYFQFTKTISDILEWDPIEVSDNFGNYNLIIDWEMRISNLVREENN